MENDMLIVDDILKYPRTAHLERSCLQANERRVKRIPYSDIAGKYVVIEEKADGANSGAHFDREATLLLQSRGHYLTGGGREKHFNLFKSWASTHEDVLFDILLSRYQMYGEWMRSKHTIFYDQLPHYFLEFDIFDMERECFLSTAARRDLIGDAPILPVPVLFAGIAPKRIEDLIFMVKPSLAKSSRWKDVFETIVSQCDLDLEKEWERTDRSDLAEGVYIKIEEGDRTVGRLKWVRSGFLQTILENEEHWLSRPLIPNQLADGVDIFSPMLTKTWEDIRRENDLLPLPQLLTREAFKEQVLNRDGGKCVFCSGKAVDAHHILDRKLFPGGGYYLDNGASVCPDHHVDCEKGVITVDEVRLACRITTVLLPPGFDAGIRYDKWGKKLRAES